MKASTFFEHLRREARGSGPRLVFFVLCLAVGVGAVVSVAGFADGLDRGIRREARRILAADLAVEGRDPIAAPLAETLSSVPGAERTDLIEMVSVVAVDSRAEADAEADAPRSLLVELKSVDGVYPFYGDLELDPPGPLAPAPDEVIVGPELLVRLGVEPGDRLRVGEASFRIAGVVRSEPDRIGGAFSMGPRLFVSAEGLERADLERFGSRIVYRSLVRLPPGAESQVDALADRLRAVDTGSVLYQVETWREAQPALRRGLRQAESFLGLAALLSLLMGGIGVAQTVASWLASRLDSIAVLKCLGYRPREVLALYLGQTLLLAGVASLVGVALGVGLQAIVGQLLAEVLPTGHLRWFQPMAWLQGLALGTGVATLFALPTLLVARRVPPIRVLRRSAEPLPMPWSLRMATAAAVGLGLFGVAAWQARSMVRGAVFVLGLAVVAAALAAAAIALMRLTGRRRHGAPLWLRHGLSALARPGAATVSATVALGLGVATVLSMALVERGLSAELDRDLPATAPTAFLVDIQPDQWSGVQSAIADAGASRVDSVPLITARLASVDGRTVDQMVAEREALEDDGEDGDLWVLRREQRLTTLETLPDDNEIVEGALWSDPDADEVSIDIAFAEDLGASVGSELVFDIQGVEVPLRVTSLRSIDWSTFGINFFLVVEPGVLDRAPQMRIAALRIPDGGAQSLQDELARGFPNVVMIQIREVIERVAAILERLGLGIRLLGWLTVVAGIAILIGAVGAGAVRRSAEVALYKTLGMTRAQVASVFAVEYALIGLVAGVLGTTGGGALSWAVLDRAMEVPFAPGWLWAPTALAATIGLSVVAGLAASVRALANPPARVLRGRD